MGWLDALERRAREAVGVEPAVSVPAVRRQSHGPAPEVKTVYVQTAPQSDGYPGAVELGFYSVTDDVVTMHDKTGKPTGKRYPLSADEDPRRVAARLTREAWLAKTPDFWRSLNYQPWSTA
jgi:hypothetical protein